MIFQKLLFNENKLILNILPVYLPYSVFACLGGIIHTARHTYATSVCLANGVSIENVAKMLGHSDTKMTRHYARVLDKSILRDMRKVDGKYQSTEI